MENKEAEVKEETVSKAEYDKLLADYTKIVKALNNLLDEYNQLHITYILLKAEQEQK